MILPPPPVSRLIGFEMKSIEPGHAIFQMEADERHHNPMGTVHGGIYCDLADAAMGFAYAATLAEGETFTTIELKINFLGAVRKAILTAEARVVKAGSTLGYVECEVKDQTGKLVAKAASTCMKLRQDRKEAGHRQMDEGQSTMTDNLTKQRFEAHYAGQAPWDIGKPQKAFIDVADQITGFVLDAGCGTGDTSLFLASRGKQGHWHRLHRRTNQASKEEGCRAWRPGHVPGQRRPGAEGLERAVR